MDNESNRIEGDIKKSILTNLSELLHGGAAKLGSIYSSIFAKFGLLVGIALIALFALVVLWAFDKIIYYYLARGYVEQIGVAFDLNKNLVNVLVILTFAVAVFFGGSILSFSKKRRLIGIGGIAALLVGHALVLWLATRQHYFGRDGVAIKCYVVTRDGSVTYGERPGVDPATGRQCRPVTAEMLERLKEYEKGKRPTLIASNEPVFFEPRTGEPVVWYYLSKSNGVEIFDLMGFHPETGEELLPVDKKAVEAWKSQTKKRLARIPHQVDPKQFAFFDPRNGTPRVWYWRDKAGNYEFYDSPGFHPLTGQALAIITPEIAQDARSKGEQRIPQPVDLKSYAPFDPQTGEPRVWYSRNGTKFEFFDAPGFHPQTGAKLAVFTKDVMEEWQQELGRERERSEQEQRRRTEELERRRQEVAAKEEAERARRGQEERRRAEELERKRQELAAKEAAERQEQRRRSQAAARCDELAANPNDPRRVGLGVPFDLLKGQASEAVTSCELAVDLNPNEPRFRYQLARSLHFVDRARAFGILRRLTDAGYPAAFDNLGWIYLNDRDSPSEALRLFQRGKDAGDPDSMISLVEMISRGHWVVVNPGAQKVDLLCRAAALGHKKAEILCQNASNDLQSEEETRKMMLNLMGNFFNNIPRR